MGARVMVALEEEAVATAEEEESSEPNSFISCSNLSNSLRSSAISLCLSLLLVCLCVRVCVLNLSDHAQCLLQLQNCFLLYHCVCKL